MLQICIVLSLLAVVAGFAPYPTSLLRRSGFSFQDRNTARGLNVVYMKLGADEKVLLIGVAADSGCGKSTFMRRLTKVFGGKNPGPLGGGFGTPGGWETNTLVSDRATVICLDDYHLNDRQGRKVSGLTALNVKEQKFDLMAEQLAALKAGHTIDKPIYNHVNGTIDTPEKVEPTPIVIVEGLHPMVDERVRKLLDFTIYLDISDEIKFAWKIQRDTQERGWTVDQVKADIEKRKPDFASYVAPQKEFSDVVISVLPSEVSSEPLGKHLKVKLIQSTGKSGLQPAYILDPKSNVHINKVSDIHPASGSGLKLASYTDKYYGKDVNVLELDGRLSNIHDYTKIEKYFSHSGAKTSNEISQEIVKVGEQAPGSFDGTGLFQTITALKLREYYEHATGRKSH